MADESLLNRVGGSSSPNPISSHAFSAGLYLLAIGSINRSQFVSRFNLAQSEETQLDEILSYFNGLTTQEKLAFHGKFESLNILREEGYITIEEYKNLLNIHTLLK